ncbi:MAG: phospholipid/cholesterol/gamma-HCH transport system permease protein [Myxococcota bacterium]|jgi:phospholipid/cholesterol/gamma-HCH transport system permease protein
MPTHSAARASLAAPWRSSLTTPKSSGPRAVLTPGIDAFAVGVYDRTAFIVRFFLELVRPPWHFKAIIDQCVEVGIRSLPLVSLTGFVVGVVFTKQSRPSLEAFGASSWLPSLITIANVRALAPLVTALICSGRVGSQIGAELGSMRVTEQIDAMEVSAINPFKYLVFTRTLATTLMVPVLTMYSGIISLSGSFLNVWGTEGTSPAAYVWDGFSTITFLDVYSSLAKAIVFGFTIGIVSCYQGYYAKDGTRGVGRAANAAVVLSMFAIFIEEALIVQIIDALRSM